MCTQIGGDYAATVTDCDSRSWVFTTNNLTAHIKHALYGAVGVTFGFERNGTGIINIFGAV